MSSLFLSSQYGVSVFFSACFATVELVLAGDECVYVCAVVGFFLSTLCSNDLTTCFGYLASIRVVSKVVSGFRKQSFELIKGWMC